MTFKSINPFDGAEVGSYVVHSDTELASILEKSSTAFQSWRRTDFEERAILMAKAGQILRERSEEFARMITLEMGKPIKEARGEVNKCAWVCDYYAQNAASFLTDEQIITDAQQSFVRHEPIGAVLAIMPWNFPFWQVFRFAAPTLMAGNVGLLKHAPNVFGCSIMIENVFKEAGFPSGVFQNIIVHHDKTEQIISHDSVKAVTLTGSEKAGSAVGELAGKYIKKSLLELGGNNAFIVWPDADLEQAVTTALTSRMMNAGQSCIAAKRFILVDSIYDSFVSKYIEAVKGLEAGDPLKEETTIGPLARKDLADGLQYQVTSSIASGADLLHGGLQRGCFHEPTILGDVTPEMSAFKEETFGPLAAMIRAKDEEHSMELAANTMFGLGVTVCTADVAKAIKYSDKVADAAFFVNELVKSDPRLPFGGTGRSGYGRELSKDGILEFVNRKTYYIK